MKVRIDFNKLFHQGQINVLKELKRFSILICGRRWGKTRFGALYLLGKALETRGMYWWIAPTYKVSDIGWNLLKGLVSNFRVTIKEADRSILLPNGSIISCRSADNPDSLRGEGLSGVVFDEVAYCKEEVWTAVIRPSLATTNGWAIFISTPRGKNWFYRLTLEAQGRDDWIVFIKPTSDNPFVPAEEIENARNTLPSVIFEQEYLAQFLDDNNSVFRSIYSVATATEAKPDEHKHGRIYFGVDLGKSNDYTVITAFCSHCKQQLFLYRSREIDYTFQEVRLQALADRWKPAKIIVEANSMGEPIIEQLKRKSLPIESFYTTNESKARIIESLELAFEQGEISILNEPNQLSELQLFSMNMSKTGKRVYSAPDGMHDDIVMSLALAWSGLKNNRPITLIAL